MKIALLFMYLTIQLVKALAELVRAAAELIRSIKC